MSRTLAFSGTASTSGALLPIDPWSATAAQVALVLADIRSWDVDHGDDDTSDAGLLATYRNALTLPDTFAPGALPFVPSGESELDAAWLAVLTERE